ncbi:MAG: AbrB/MazE/SpoVT family DNA-binding domain-containing protein [Cyanobacteria bacterium J06639_14]
MLKALQQTVKVGAGGKIEFIAPECPEGSDVQVIVLLAPTTQFLEPGQSQSAEVDEAHQQQASAIEKIQAMVRRYVPEGTSLVDELIAERRAEAERE